MAFVFDGTLNRIDQRVRALEAGAVNNSTPITATGTTTARQMADRFADWVNVLDFDAQGDGSTDDTAAFQAAEAASAAIYVPAGTYLLSDWTQAAACEYRGAGIGATILKRKASATNLFTQAARARFSDLTFDMNSGGGSALRFGTSHGFSLERVQFQNMSPTSWTVYVEGARNGRIEECTFVGKAGASLSYGIRLDECEDISIARSRFFYMDYALYGSANANPARTVRVTDNYFDGAWWLWVTRIAGGSGATYGTDTLTDSGQTWTGSIAGETVRVLPVVTSGTATSYTEMGLTHSGASFLSTVSVGMLVRASSSQGVVSAVLSDTQLEVEGWLSTADLSPLVPVSGTYSVRDPIIGQVEYPGGFSGSTLTVYSWKRMRTGATVTSISAATEYELVHPHGVYAGPGTGNGARGWVISGNHVRRSWADAISYCGTAGVVSGNTLYENKDQGITIGTPSQGTAGNLITGNVIERQGVSGIAVLSDDNLISGNKIVGPQWFTATDSGAILVDTGQRNKIIGNSANASGNSYAYGVVITPSGADDNVIEGNTFAGYTANLAYLYFADGVIVRGNTYDRTKGITGSSYTLALPNPDRIDPPAVTLDSDWSSGTGLVARLTYDGNVVFSGGILTSVSGSSNRRCATLASSLVPPRRRWIVISKSNTGAYPAEPADVPVAVVATVEHDATYGYAAGDVVIHDTIAGAGGSEVYYFDGASYRLDNES